MSTTPAGWHPDPSGRHEYRLWDGARWTDQVADGGVASTDPLPPQPPAAASAATGEQVLLDTTVSAGVRGKRRWVVTDRALYDAGRPYPYDAVTSLSYLTTEFTGSGVYNLVYDVWLAGPDGKPVRIYWSGQGQHEQDVFHTTVQALHRYVVPRLVGQMVERITAGGTVEIGSVQLSMAGIGRKKLIGGKAEVVGWSPTMRVQAGEGLATVLVGDGPKPARAAAVSLKEPNAPLLAPLIDVMVQVTGAGG